MLEVTKAGIGKRVPEHPRTLVKDRTSRHEPKRLNTASPLRGAIYIPAISLQQEIKKSGYKPRVTIFGSASEIVSPKASLQAKYFGKELAQKGYAVIVNGNLSGLAKIISDASLENSGEVFGVAMKEEGIVPNGQFTEFEAYSYEYEMYRRLLELGDILVFLPDAKRYTQDLESLKQINKRKIFIGEETSDLEQALGDIKKYFAYLEESNYHSPIYYPALGPKEYFNHIMQNTNNYEMLYENTLLTVFPGVFPSNRFRSSKAMGKLASEVSEGKVVADICSGLGSIGIAAYNAGAKHVVLGDINPNAVRNAKHNINKLRLNPSKIKVYESDVFKSIPDEYKGKLDVIFFSPPFFKEKLSGDEELLMHAFLADGKEGGVIDRFLSSAKDYLAPEGVIYLTFSNKDPEHLQFLEDCFSKYGYDWKLKLIRNKDAVSDTRIYEVISKNQTASIN